MQRFDVGIRVGLLCSTFCVRSFCATRSCNTRGNRHRSVGRRGPERKVTITEVGTGQVYSLLTGAGGEFVRPALKPSTYTVTRQRARDSGRPSRRTFC